MDTIKTIILRTAQQNPNYQGCPPGIRYEIAKTFVKKKLCSNCRRSFVDIATKDIKNLARRPCSRCQTAISTSLDNIIHAPHVHPLIYKKNIEARRKILDEILNKTGDSPYYLLEHLHKVKMMSTPVICEHLYQNYQITISPRFLGMIMRDWGILDTLVMALRKRVVNKRMIYTTEAYYEGMKRRKIDYKLREKRKKQGLPPHNHYLKIRVRKGLRQQIERVSKEHGRTISETVRMLFKSIEGIKFLESITNANKLEYALKHNRKYLKTNHDSLHGIKVILEVVDHQKLQRRKR